MKIVDSGVIGQSFMDFTIPTEFAKNALYYVPQYGHFYCNGSYRIARETLDWFLMILVCAGSLYLESNGEVYTAKQNEIVFLDCRRPHRYYCKDTANFMWFHFSGSSAIQYADLLSDQRRVVFPNEGTAIRLFQNIFSLIQRIPCNEHRISADIHQLLSFLAVPQKNELDYQPVEPAIAYIRKHFEQPIPLDTLSAQCNMSTSHFIRTFQKLLNRTPHEYLLAFRLLQSKRLLSTTSLTIEQIAAECGFNSASHFARAFRHSNGISPTEFRHVQF